jgi:arylsulfatase A-like enzyme
MVFAGDIEISQELTERGVSLLDVPSTVLSLAGLDDDEMAGSPIYSDEEGAPVVAAFGGLRNDIKKTLAKKVSESELE